MAEKLLLKNLMNPQDSFTETTFRISGSCFNTKSHSITNCIDVAKGTNPGYSFYAPVRMKCIAQSGDDYNTAYLQSVNEVEFANGQTGILSMSFGHANSLWYGVTPADGYIEKGTRIYVEGTGGGVARHCHIRVGKGAMPTGYKAQTIGGFQDPLADTDPELDYKTVKQWEINSANGALTFSDAFYKDDMTVTYTDNAMRKKYKWRETTDSIPGKNWVVGTYAAFNIRVAPVLSAAIRYQVPKGGRARIVTFLPNFRVDGYQWAYVDYNNGQYYGYAQLDLKNNQLIMHDTNAIDLYFETINESVDIMNTITGTIVKGTIPVNKAVKINFLTTSKATDNYQWANVTYNGVTGYVKLDVQSVSNINFTSTSDSAV